jgi:hypothetical protein
MSEHAGAWYTNPEFLKKTGRGVISHFFAAFAADLEAANVTLPDPNLPDDLYFAAAARFLEARRRRQWLTPRRLPVCLEVPRFSLEPLRELGSDALMAHDVPGVVRIVLCEIKVISPNGHCETHTAQSDNLFETPPARGARHPAIRRVGRLTRATLRIQFADSSTPRAVVLCPPQTLQLLQESDAEPVMCWLARRGFRLPQPCPPSGPPSNKCPDSTPLPPPGPG